MKSKIILSVLMICLLCGCSSQTTIHEQHHSEMLYEEWIQSDIIHIL